MRKLGPDASSRGIEISPTSSPDLAASRRHLLSAALLVGGLAATRLLGPTKALADASDPGCQNSGSQPPSCICFLKGTEILTPLGERPIEVLRIGDLLLTISGEPRPIKWIGRMRFDRREQDSWHDAVAPVKIARGTFNGELPRSDLYVSAAHRFYINGLLITAGDLINGGSITRMNSTSLDVLEYLHIELESHDVILANGAPAESLQGNANRTTFDNFGEYVALYGALLTCHTPYAPCIGGCGGRQALRAHLRCVLAPIFDRRQPLEIVQDELAKQDRRLAA